MKAMPMAAIALSAVIMLSGCGSAASSADETSREAAPAQTAAADSPAESSTAQTEAQTEAQSEAEAETEGAGMEKYSSLITELPPDGYDQAREGVVYPEFKKLKYYSQTAERDTKVNVLLPADYDESKKYPVLYILHGFYDTEDWMARKKVALSQILTNLVQDGKAEEMIVVLPYIFCSKELEYTTGMDYENCLAYDNFINDLETDLMPFIRENFSVAEGRENTAVTGFSMGGRESLFIGFRHPEQFGYIGAVCPAPGLAPGQLSPDELSFADDVKPYALLISSSFADGTVGSSPDTYRGYLDSNGEPFLSHFMQKTGHDHTSVKPHLYNFMQMLFKD